MGPQMVCHFIFCFYFFLIIRERMMMMTTPHTHYHHNNNNSGNNHKTWWGVQPRKRTEHEWLLENGWQRQGWMAWGGNYFPQVAEAAIATCDEFLPAQCIGLHTMWVSDIFSNWRKLFFWLNSTFSAQHGSSWTSAVTLPTHGAKFLNVTFSCPSKLLPPQTPCI